MSVTASTRDLYNVLQCFNGLPHARFSVGFLAHNELVSVNFVDDPVLVKPELSLRGPLIDLESSRHQSAGVG